MGFQKNESPIHSVSSSSVVHGSFRLTEIARLGIVSMDPYDAATALTEAESQLDTLYTVTARLSRLSLANYL